MIASKVSFTQHTKELLNARPLARKDKIRIRRQRIVEYIRELPFGECQKADLIAAAGWDISVQQQYSNGWSFIERLKKNKVIQMSDGSNPKNTYIKHWEVVGDIHIVKPAVQPIQFKDEEPVIHTPSEQIAAEEEWKAPEPKVRPSSIVLDYAHKVSNAAELLGGYTKTDELNAYRSGLLKAVELLQDVE